MLYLTSHNTCVLLQHHSVYIYILLQVQVIVTHLCLSAGFSHLESWGKSEN